MNKTKQQETNTYLPYWKADSLRIRKQYRDIKITVEKKVKRRKDGKEITIRHRVFPTAKDVLIEQKAPALPVLKTATERKQEKVEKYEKLPFSNLHNKWIDKLYSKENRLVKQQAAVAAHENKIKDLMFKMQQEKLRRDNERREKKTNVLVINRFDSKGVSYPFSTNPSNLSLKELKKIGESLRDKLQEKVNDFDCVKIYKKENLREDKPTYYIYKNVA